MILALASCAWSPGTALRASALVQHRRATTASHGLRTGQVLSLDEPEGVPVDMSAAFEMFNTFEMAFSAFDLDGDGTITVAELACVTAEKLGKPVSEEALLRLVAEFDDNSNGTMDFDEFVDLLTRQPSINAEEAAALESVRAVARKAVQQQRAHTLDTHTGSASPACLERRWWGRPSTVPA